MYRLFLRTFFTYFHLDGVTSQIFWYDMLEHVQDMFEYVYISLNMFEYMLKICLNLLIFILLKQQETS